MAKQPDSTVAPQPKPIEVRLGDPEPDTMRDIAGSRSDRFNVSLINAMARTCWIPPGQSEADRNEQMFAAVTAMRAFAPANEVEAMIVAQTMAAHHASMECSRRAMLADQPFEIAQQLHKTATNASRVFIELIAALDRRRGKGGQQKVTVEHVHIHSGGQAVVGNIAAAGRPGGGGAPEMLEEPCGAPARLAHDAAIGAVLPSLWRADAEREIMPVARDEESPPVPPARRAQHGATDTGGPGADPCRPDNARDAHGRDGADAQAGAGAARRR